MVSGSWAWLVGLGMARWPWVDVLEVVSLMVGGSWGWLVGLGMARWPWDGSLALGCNHFCVVGRVAFIEVLWGDSLEKIG